jgi:signal transduction histidine kinase/ActR/RegA family two-component response regulator
MKTTAVTTHGPHSSVDRRGATRRRAVTLALLAAAILLYIIPLLVGENQRLLAWWSDCSMTLAAIAVTLKCVQVARRLEGHERAAWVWFGLGMAAWSIGNVVWAAHELAFNQPAPAPTLADPLQLVLPVLFALGLWRYRTRFQPVGVTFLEIGNLGIILASILAIHIILFFGVIHTASQPGTTIAIDFLRPALNASVFFFGLVTVSLYLRGQRRTIMLLLLLGLAANCGAELFVSYGILSSNYSSASPINAMYVAWLACVYWAAFEQNEFSLRNSMSELESDARMRVSQARQWETLIPMIAVVSVLAVAVGFHDRVTAVIAPYALFALVLFVVSLGLRDWWSHRIEANLREQALASEAELKASENHLTQKNAELVDANLGLWREMQARREIEEELRQSQKMEVLGQLTGGVAHDFNNLLAVILGNMELLEQRLGADSDLRVMTQDAITASERGGELTRHLLAFARKQALTPSSIEVRQLLEQMRALLTSTLGETIRIEIDTADDLWPCVADRAQLENALLNLAINARDAMPEGGSLVINAVNVTLGAEHSAAEPDAEAGDYVLMKVRDAGVGMSNEVRAKAFEPFFTTKEIGAGSGLGLSMVYGFVKQSGGDVAIRSEPGTGTTVDLYLPRADVSADSTTAGAARDFRAGQGERILVVEDEPAVRKLVVTLLEDLGYEVFQAEDGTAALAALDDLDSIRLVLSDLVLPGGLSGREMLSEVKRVHPEVKTLLMSGYATDSRRREDEAEGGAEEILHKPFRKLDLARKIRSTLKSDL